MSLEAALAENTAALNRNSELMIEAAAGRERVIGLAENAAAPKKPAAKKASEEKPAAAVEEKAETPPPAAASSEAATAITTWLKASTEGTAERAARTAKVKELFGKVGATNAATIPADKVKAFVNTIAKLTAEGNLVPDEPADDDLL